MQTALLESGGTAERGAYLQEEAHSDRSDRHRLLPLAAYGDFRFDEEFWPDPKAMADELHEMGIRLMVSIWPQVDLQSENYDEMRHHNYLAKTRQGKDVGMWWPRDNQFFDATNPAARDFVWELCRKNYTDLGVDALRFQRAGYFGQRGVGAALLVRTPVDQQNFHGPRLVSRLASFAREPG